MAQRARLLRGARRRAGRRRRRDQARLPQARPAVAPRRQHRARGAGAVQGDQRGLPGPVRSPSAARQYDMFGKAGVIGRGRPAMAEPPGFGGFSDIFDAFFGGSMGGANRRGARDRRRAPTCATTSGSRSRRRCSGPRRRSSSRSSAGATPAGAAARSRAPSATQCPQCKGRGEIRSIRQTMLGQMVNVSPLPALPRRGQDHRDRRARRATARAAPSASARLRVSIPAGIDEGHQIRLSNEGEVGPRGGAPGSLYVAVHVAAAPDADPRGHRALLRGRPVDRPGRARDEDPGADGRGRRTPRSRSSPARSPGTEIRLRGRGVPHLRRSVVARRPPRHRQRHVPTKLTQAPARAARGSTRRGRARRCRRTPGCARSWAWGERRARSRPTDRPARRPRPRRRGRARRALARARRSPPTTRPSRPCPRSCPGPRPAGRRVEPAFELVDEGLAARVDLARPALVRAHLPLLDVAAVRAAVARAERELGHLQAFGLRPIGDLDGTHRPRGRLGERVEGALPGAAGRPPDRDPPDVAAPPPPAGRRRPRARPGHGVRDRAPPDDPAVPRGARVAWPIAASCAQRDDGRGAGARRRLGLRDPLDRGRAAGRRAGARVDVDPIAVEATSANAKRNGLGASHQGAGGELAQRRGAVRRRRSPTSSRRC